MRFYLEVTSLKSTSNVKYLPTTVVTQAFTYLGNYEEKNLKKKTDLGR